MMKKRMFFLLLWYAFLILFVLLAAILPLLGYTPEDLVGLATREQLLFTLILLLILLTFFLSFLVQTISLLSTQTIRHTIHRILQKRNQVAVHSQDPLMAELATTVYQLTRQVQELDNQDLVKQEEIVEAERKRIARDLHDTVSQELFASSMILSGLAHATTPVDPTVTQKQLQTVQSMIETAQKDLRILLLHLRPSELNGKSLVEGFQTLLNEVSDKSRIQVSFQHEVSALPTVVEDHLFRIAQEIISNTLKHSQAQHLDVYLIEHEGDVQLKMVDDGIGFQPEKEKELSYGLQNIQDRVADMAGTVKIRSAQDKGVSIDIRIPLLKGNEDEKNHSIISR
ncbi:sensor histidine kinase [Streptococcus sp. DD13]|uniref:sensor histidine kinase n=1 Tax=Streptococcus sp. DD13 TaxID=1777881 RepID=UPI00079A355B|nr:sensor histidine kinase [Streptococcus sp. DD13]KXT77461.1 Sensor histidine kinase VraS [Streptococcus sp. DD13]